MDIFFEQSSIVSSSFSCEASSNKSLIFSKSFNKFLYEFKISSKNFFCFTVFLTKFLSFQKFSLDVIVSNFFNLNSTFSLSKIPPNIIKGFFC